MRYGKLTVYLFTLLFAAVAAVLWRFEPQRQTLPIALTLTSAGDERNVTCWENEAGEYYLFLPSYAEPASARLQIFASDVRIDGQPAEEGMSCEGFQLDTPYSFSFDSEEGRIDTFLTFQQSKGLPTLYVDTGSGSMDYIHGKKGNQEAGRMSLYMPDGELAYIGNLDKINGRGNDWLIAKKSYSLQLASAADLLGMGQAEKWILVANAFDASHLRNKLVYDFAGAVGLAYSPRSNWVDLYLNGEYAGLYLLCERNELHGQRVSLEGTGQYLVSMDTQWRLEQNARPFVTTRSGYAFRIHGSQINDKQLQQLLQSVENAISAEDGRDTLTGKHWSELIDLDSWVKKYLVEEIFGNGDGGAISQYFYGSDDEGLMYAGPVWDFDISMGNSQGLRGGEPQAIFASRSRVRSNISLSWYYELYRQEAFRERMVELYQETFLPLLDTFLNEYLEQYVSQISESAAMNQLRWETAEGVYAESENIRSFMEERIAFLNQLWLEGEPFCRVLIDTDDGHGTVCFAVRPGECVPYLPEYEPAPEILGWYAAGSEEPFDITQPVYEDMEIILRRTEPEPAGEETAETGESGRKIPVKYVPFVLLLGFLGIFCLIDGSRRRRKRKQEALTEKAASVDKIGRTE